MIPALDPFLPTALPVLLFLVWWPVAVAWPHRYRSAFWILASLTTLTCIAGWEFAAALCGAHVLGYGIIEAAARLQYARRVVFAATFVLLHAAYFACFALPVPSAYAHAGGANAPGVFVFFSGIALSFLRLVRYLHDRLRHDAPPLAPQDFFATLLFFPQFRHGPVETPHEFAAQMAVAQPRGVDLLAGLARVVAGLATFAVFLAVLRLFRKALPEEILAAPERLFQFAADLAPWQAWVVLVTPAVALYFAESAYASMQLGVSRAFGVQGRENFRFPFLATDPRVVWHRWNITLSTWLRDCIYVPLGGNRRRKYLNIVLTFVYCGLLHGPQLRCLAWGLWAGSTVAIYAYWADLRAVDAEPRTGLGRLVARVLTFLWFCVGVTIILDADTLGWPLFRRLVGL
ncbi:MAG: hypothetical protein IPM18_04210 [Phycisphaerales bacterium]|nr:hypothetical protein [Phycisphaerales bacterium]